MYSGYGNSIAVSQSQHGTGRGAEGGPCGVLALCGGRGVWCPCGLFQFIRVRNETVLGLEPSSGAS